MDSRPSEPVRGRFSFEWFSSLPNYRAANRAQVERFLAGLRIPTPWVGIDIACGVGLMSELCQDVAERLGASVLGTVMVDRDINALEIARGKLAAYRVALLQGLGQSLPLPDDFGSFVVIGNGIHNFAEDAKRSLFGEAYRVMQSGAGLFFNSAFYSGSIVAGTERFYMETVRRALRLARELVAGTEATVEGRGDDKPRAARPVDASGYQDLARAAGFSEVNAPEMVVPMDQALWEAIADYADYALGALHHRFRADVACTAMRQATREVFEDPLFTSKYPGAAVVDGRVTVPRRWLWVTGTKP